MPISLEDFSSKSNSTRKYSFTYSRYGKQLYIIPKIKNNKINCFIILLPLSDLELY
jgi:hypothetical protein